MRGGHFVPDWSRNAAKRYHVTLGFGKIHVTACHRIEGFFSKQVVTWTAIDLGRGDADMPQDLGWQFDGSSLPSNLFVSSYILRVALCPVNLNMLP